MKNRKQLTYSFLLIIGVLGLINILANTFFLRLDLTEDKRYTLSKATKNILKELKDPVTVTAYFSKNLPTELIKGREDFKDLLVEYASRSKNKLVYWLHFLQTQIGKEASFILIGTKLDILENKFKNALKKELIIKLKHLGFIEDNI